MTKTHCMLEHTDIGPESEHGCTQLLLLVTMDYILAVKAATATFTTYRKLALISLYISQASCGICYKKHNRIELNMIQCSKSSRVSNAQMIPCGCLSLSWLVQLTAYTPTSTLSFHSPYCSDKKYLYCEEQYSEFIKEFLRRSEECLNDEDESPLSKVVRHFQRR